MPESAIDLLKRIARDGYPPQDNSPRFTADMALLLLNIPEIVRLIERVGVVIGVGALPKGTRSTTVNYQRQAVRDLLESYKALTTVVWIT